jgi:predicted Zn-dependent peptidase
MRVESEPQGKLLQMFLATAFSAFPYRIMGTGWPSDVAHLRRADAWRFFHEFYVPGNITLGIVGDVNPADARRLAEKYFGPMQARPLPPLLHTVEPAQEGPKQAEVESPSQPLLVVGYKRPDQLSKEDPVFDVISGVLSSGRTGLLYKELVRDKQIALEAEAEDTFPGGKYPNLFLFFLAPAAGHTTAENEKAFYEVLEKFKSQKVDDATLARVKTKTRASLIRRLDSNSGLAGLLTAYYAIYGDWRKLFTSLDELDRITADDVQRVAQECFVPEKRTVAYLIAPKPATGGTQ